MRLVIVVQARTGSASFPRKIMHPLAGRPMLLRQLERITAARVDAELVVATTTWPEDEPVVTLCRSAGIAWHRGHPTDLLSRHVSAGRMFNADVIVKVPADCPLIDPGAIERVVGAFLAAGPGAIDYASNLHPATWPDGNDVEVVPMALLEDIDRVAHEMVEREQTTPYIWSRPGRYRLLNVAWEAARHASSRHKLRVDGKADYELARWIYDELWSAERVFRLAEILALLDATPRLTAGW